ncbi:Crp/Fnr family transcriptional regulator [Tabrizicola sp.]|uniref:Crp/Fnr family transcriptional regulator n=1 Tax=Tabrizicola sp. TaxID=2005166 RepID=UPI0035B29047
MTHWTDRFSGLAALPEDVAHDLETRSRVVHLPAGTRVFAPGQRAQNMLLLLSGSVRVQQVSDTGREVFLYRVQAGESCVLTTACMLADEDYSAEGIAETDIAAVAIPRAVFDDLSGRSPVFRRFIFQTYSRRIADLFGLIDDIVFQRLDVRLAERLLALEHDGLIAATHQALAVELGTAREVISRTLGEFQRRGWVELSRGEIRITSRAGLERLSRSVT